MEETHVHTTAKAALAVQIHDEAKAHANWLMKVRNLVIAGYHDGLYCLDGLNTFLQSEDLAEYETFEPHDIMPEPDPDQALYTTAGLQHIRTVRQEKYAAQRERIKLYAIGQRGTVGSRLPGWFAELDLGEYRLPRRITVSIPEFTWETTEETRDVETFKTDLIAAIRAAGRIPVYNPDRGNLRRLAVTIE